VFVGGYYAEGKINIKNFYASFLILIDHLLQNVKIAYDFGKKPKSLPTLLGYIANVFFSKK